MVKLMSAFSLVLFSQLSVTYSLVGALIGGYFLPSLLPDTDAEKPGSAKRRRKSTSASGSTPLSRVRSPGSLLKPALTERQQMALLLQMTDPQKQQQQPTPSGAGTGIYQALTLIAGRLEVQYMNSQRTTYP